MPPQPLTWFIVELTLDGLRKMMEELFDPQLKMRAQAIGKKLRYGIAPCLVQ